MKLIIKIPQNLGENFGEVLNNMKDWTGDNNSVFKIIGASNHSSKEREEHDFYATSPEAVEMLLEHETLDHYLWEPACGEGHISQCLLKHGYIVRSTDLIDRGYGTSGIDFLKEDVKAQGDIITNPPYRYATEFILKALELVEEGHHVYMFLKLTALEGQKRYKNIYSKYPPKTVYVFSKRVNCWKNGEPDDEGSAVAYAWYVWEKGYTGPTTLKWI